jgi:membrane-associated phospholipid phosphatase
LDNFNIKANFSVNLDLYRQPRPYWLSSEVKMLEWTCYTEYGNPSGHSALVIVLLDFLVRFGCRWSKKFENLQILWYILVFIGQIVVMFSRLYLGMHSLNQILVGFMIGAYSLVPYYIYIEKILFFFCIKFLS